MAMDDKAYEERLEEARELQELIEAFALQELLYLEFDSRLGKDRERFDFYKKPDYFQCLYSPDTKEKAQAFIMGFYCGG